MSRETCRSDHPNVCKHCASRPGICYLAMEGSEYCSGHGGTSQLRSQKTEASNQYRLHIWKSRLREFTESNSVKSIRDEIGILRIVLEETINKCTDGHELLMHSSKISDLAVKIEKLVSSCDRLERNMGEMLDRPSALKFATAIVDIVARNTNDADLLDKISHEILELMR